LILNAVSNKLLDSKYECGICKRNANNSEFVGQASSKWFLQISIIARLTR
jgi:hypothetical protein